MTYHRTASRNRTVSGTGSPHSQERRMTAVLMVSGVVGLAWLGLMIFTVARWMLV